VRGAFVQGFPFTIVYRAEHHGIFVIAFAHEARNVGYWRDRIGDI